MLIGVVGAVGVVSVVGFSPMFSLIEYSLKYLRERMLKDIIVV